MPFHPPKVLGAGLLALDLVISPEPNAPIRSWAGGTCGNVLSILAGHGWDAYPIARMNGDAASKRVRSDLERLGVHLDLASCEPTANTPIVVQEIGSAASGRATHKFSWVCPRCGGWLPSFKPVTRAVVNQVRPYLTNAAVFFFDRVSRGTLEIAEEAASAGAVVMFEPSGRGDGRLFAEALRVAHVVKYADQRIGSLAHDTSSGNLVLEIQTFGADGLRFRLLSNQRNRKWRTLKAAQAPIVVDSCGSGDWCTAGLLSRIATDGAQGLLSASVATIAEALQYGQRLAAWNCSFEGARGGMYESGLMPWSDGSNSVSRLHYARVSARSEVQEQIPVSCPKCEAA